MTTTDDQPLTVDQLNALPAGTDVEGPGGDIYRKRRDRLWRCDDSGDLLDSAEMVEAGGGVYLYHPDDEAGDLEDAAGGAAGSRKHWMYGDLDGGAPPMCPRCGSVLVKLGSDGLEADDGCSTCGWEPDDGDG